MKRIRLARGIKPSTITCKHRKTIKEVDLCFNCKNQFPRISLQIEHEIPVCLGGDIESYRLFCYDCHKIKTKIDLQIIFFFQKTGLLIKLTPNEYEAIDNIKELYLTLFNIIKDNNNRF